MVVDGTWRFHVIARRWAIGKVTLNRRAAEKFGGARSAEPDRLAISPNDIANTSLN
jgi:hypothetical protein